MNATWERITGPRRGWTETDDSALATILELRQLWESGARTFKRLGFDAELSDEVVDGDRVLYGVPGIV